VSKSRPVRLSSDVYEFIASMWTKREDTFSKILERILPAPEGQLKWAVGAILMDDIETARAMSEELKQPIITVQVLDVGQ